MLYIPNDIITIKSITEALANAGAEDIYSLDPIYPTNDDGTIYPENLVALKFYWRQGSFADLVNAAIKIVTTLTLPIETIGMLEIQPGYFPELQAAIILGNLESFLSRDMNAIEQWVHFQFGT